MLISFDCSHGNVVMRHKVETSRTPGYLGPACLCSLVDGSDSDSPKGPGWSSCGIPIPFRVCNPCYSSIRVPKLCPLFGCGYFLLGSGVPFRPGLICRTPFQEVSILNNPICSLWAILISQASWKTVFGMCSSSLGRLVS